MSVYTPDGKEYKEKKSSVIGSGFIVPEPIFEALVELVQEVSSLLQQESDGEKYKEIREGFAKLQEAGKGATINHAGTIIADEGGQ